MTPSSLGTEMEAREQLAEIYTPEGVEIWLNGHNRALGGGRPINMLRCGPVVAQRVLDLISEMNEGSA